MATTEQNLTKAEVKRRAAIARLAEVKKERKASEEARLAAEQVRRDKEQQATLERERWQREHQAKLEAERPAREAKAKKAAELARVAATRRNDAAAKQRAKKDARMQKRQARLAQQADVVESAKEIAPDPATPDATAALPAEKKQTYAQAMIDELLKKK